MPTFPNRRPEPKEIRKAAARICQRRGNTTPPGGGPDNAFPVFTTSEPYNIPAIVTQGQQHQDNGDEQHYRNDAHFGYFGSFTKGLPHGSDGRPDKAAYEALVKALEDTRTPPDNSVDGYPKVEAVPRGTARAGRPFVNPLAGVAFDLNGADAFDLTLPPAPPARSAEAAGEMAELYWMALARDLPFSRYGESKLVERAAADLTTFASEFKGPTTPPGDPDAGKVTSGTIFRGSSAGNLDGYYVSQFLLRPIVFGTLLTEQRQKTALPHVDYMTDLGAWLAVQKGVDTTGRDRFDPVRRYIRNLRDLATYVHFDQLHEAYFNACLILLDMGAPFADGNPYSPGGNQQGFGTFGGPHVLSLVTEVATRALKAVWLQKWFVHRRLRPEQYGGRLELVLGAPGASLANYVDQRLLDSVAFGEIRGSYGSCLLPQAFPEGSPMHPAYGAGHATVAGACVTVLKAWFRNGPLADPVVPNDEGTELIKDPAAPGLTIHGELNKLASNISIGRNAAGVHWRTDYTKSVSLGEAIAVALLQEQSIVYNERAKAEFKLRTFGGKDITVREGKVTSP